MKLPGYTKESFGQVAITDADLSGLEEGRLNNARIAGLTSRNKRIYDPKAYSEALAKYNGLPVNIDHFRSPEGEVSVLARFGRITNPRIDNDGGLRADLTFNPNHEFAKTFIWFVRNDPNALCFSHLAKLEGESRVVNGQLVKYVTAIEDVASVDIVADGGTTKGVFESFNPGENTMDLASLKPEEIAKLFTDVGTFRDWLAALVKALALMPEEKLSAIEDVLSGMEEPEPADEDGAESVRLKRLGRRGKCGKWAAESFARFKAQEQAAKHRAAVDKLIGESGLSSAIVGESFKTKLYGMSAEAASVAIEGMRLAAQANQTPPATDPVPPRTNPAPGPKTTEQLMKEAWAA